MACAAWFPVLIVLNALVLLQGSRPWSHKQSFPSSQIPESALNPEKPITKRKILQYHNFFRTKVQPTASNMLIMTWHKEAAQQAQKYAEKCVYLRHNGNEERTVTKLGACGQNLFVASQKTTWFFAIKAWFLEYQNFTYGVPVTDLKAVGHYTQMVWATSHKVGCGFAHCPGGPWGHFYNYVCHYCPGGNIDTKTHYPYKVGPPCGDCPDQCSAGKLCTNACNERDFYSNCAELIGSGHNMLCPQGYCNATCLCKDTLLHKNHPW